jgi:predicted ferric reductase
MTFIIKGLGDYTKRLPATLKAGEPVKVKGPYGQFNFSSNKPRQIWVGGGIGITPFPSGGRAISGSVAPRDLVMFCSVIFVREAFRPTIFIRNSLTCADNL